MESIRDRYANFVVFKNKLANGSFQQPPEVTLQLNVVEARNLKGKDVNGTCKQVDS